MKKDPSRPGERQGWIGPAVQPRLYCADCGKNAAETGTVCVCHTGSGIRIRTRVCRSCFEKNYVLCAGCGQYCDRRQENMTPDENGRMICERCGKLFLYGGSDCKKERETYRVRK